MAALNTLAIFIVRKKVRTTLLRFQFQEPSHPFAIVSRVAVRRVIRSCAMADLDMFAPDQTSAHPERLNPNIPKQSPAFVPKGLRSGFDFRLPRLRAFDSFERKNQTTDGPRAQKSMVPLCYFNENVRST